MQYTILHTEVFSAVRNICSCIISLKLLRVRMTRRHPNRQLYQKLLGEMWHYCGKGHQIFTYSCDLGAILIASMRVNN